MAKYPHRIFEMYEFHDEATRALTPKLVSPATEATSPKPWTLKHLAISCTAGVTHVRFKSAQSFEGETASDLGEDFSELADSLDRNSKVLFDFEGVTSFSAASINALDLFKRQLRNKGSRIALCCLDPTVKQSFFKRSNGHENGK